MPRCHEILNEVIERTGLDRFVGHPLYSYKITTEELESLRTELKNLLTIAGKFRTSEECSAFCLFGAEWFRRHYDRGVWSWQTIFDGLDIDLRDWDSLKQQVGDFTISGLQWWRIDLIQTRLSRRYLTTLVCQGGFPINTLRNDGAGLSRYLKSCLKDHERYPSEPLGEITQKYVSYIPATLDNSDVRRLVGDLVRVIASLRKQSDDASTCGFSRFDYLEQYHLGWERQLPLRVEEPEAKELLISLLDVARSEPFSNRSISVSTTLELGPQEASISRRLKFPSTLSEEDFRRLMGYTSNEHLPPRMTGYLQAGEVRTPCINIARSHDGTKFRLINLDSTSLFGREAFQKTILVLAVGGQEIKRIDLSGGEELPDSPWVFIDEESGNLIGVGTVKSRDAQVIVAIPTGCEVREEQEGTEIEQLDVKVAGRDILRLTGSATFVRGDISFKVVTKSEQEEAFLYELRGKRQKLGIGGSTIWVGTPSAFEVPISDDGFPVEVCSDRVEWRPASGGDWKSCSRDCVGDILIRVQANDGTAFLSKATVFPSTFRFRVVSGSKPGEGRLRLSGLGTAQICSAQMKLVGLKTEHTEDGQTIHVSVTGQRPSLLDFRFHFANGNESDISFVCPTESIGVINAAGQILPPTHGIPVDRMDGLSLQIIQPGGAVPLIYDKQFGLLLDCARETNVEGVFEFPLSYAKDHATGILGLSSDPDREVKYEVRIGHRERNGWTVARYGRILNKRTATDINAPNVTEFYIDDDLTSELAGSQLQLRVTPLGRPKEEVDSDSISLLSPGRWFVDHTSYSPGYYLAVARHTHGECLRPIRFVVKPDYLDVQKAVEPTSETLFDYVLNMRSADGRQAAWDEFFDLISKDYSHPGWQRVTDMVEASYEVPITTYEPIAALTRNPEAVARFGILEPHKARLWQRFERLPFLWSLIPIQAWLNTAESAMTFVRRSLVNANLEHSEIDQLVRQYANRFAAEAPNRIPSMSCVVLCFWRTRMGFDFDPQHLRIAGNDQLEGLSLEDRDREQTRLIDQKSKADTRFTWPNFRIDFDETVREIFNSTRQLPIRDTFKNQWAVLNGPAIAAVFTVYGFPVSKKQVCQFKRLRALDPEWYDKANAIATFLLMQRRFNEETNPFHIAEE